MKIYVIKALYRSTSKTLLIRAKSPHAAFAKALKLKECKEGVIDWELLETRDETWRKRAL